MKRSLLFMHVLGLAVIFLIMSHCTSDDRSRRTIYSVDTTQLVQTVLSDKQLEAEIVKDFGDAEFKLVTNSIIKAHYKFVFSNKAVLLMSVSGDTYQIHQQHPKELYVSVPSVKLFSRDSASVSLIFHAGNATALFFLKNEQEKWKVIKRQYGKF